MSRFVITCFLVLCAAYAVSAQYPVALYQRQGNSTCQDFPLDSCNLCVDNCGRERYFRCENDGDHFDCYEYSDYRCEYIYNWPGVRHAECGQLGSCAIGYQQKFTVEWSVQATSSLAAYSEPHGRESYVQLSGVSAVTQGHVTNVLYSSGSDQVRFETAFNETTYLTSAGTCDFGQQCSAGSLTYEASVLPLANLTEPELQGTRVEIHTDGVLGFKNANSASSNAFTALLGDELNIGSDELSELVLEASRGDTSIVLSNLVLGREEGDNPVLYFELETTDGRSEYDYVTCEWENRYDSSNEWYGFGSFYTFGSFGEFYDFGSFGQFYSFTTFGYWWDDVVTDVRAERKIIPEATAVASPVPSASRTISPAPSSSRSPSHQCQPVYIDPMYYDDDDDEEYIHCSLDSLFWSNEFLNYGGGFESFARVQPGPLERLSGALFDAVGMFRL